MAKKPKYDEVDRFTQKGHAVVIRTVDNRTEIVVDDEPHEVRFLDNGRPYTRAYVNVMASSVRDLAEKFVEHKAAQEAHWAEISAQPDAPAPSEGSAS